MQNAQLAPPTPRSIFDSILIPISKVHSGEGLGAILLASNACLLLFTYYILKTAREPLILDQPNGAEVKSFSTAIQALLFLIIVPAYGRVASRLPRLGLMTSVTLFFASNLGLFFLAGQSGFKIGAAFYIWLGIFNMLAVSQFWAFANDLYTEEEGGRLFPIVGVGASLGAWIGSIVAERYIRTLGPYQLMAIGAVLLGFYLGLIWLVNGVESRRVGESRASAAKKPLDKSGGFQLVLSDPYLKWIAILVLILNAVNSTGEYVLGRFVVESAAALPATERGAFIGEFYGSYFGWVSLLGFLLQTFLCSRLIGWIGMYPSLFLLPAVSLTGYSLLLGIPVLFVIKGAKIVENSVDYSINNTVRQGLFLSTSREAKYKSKAAIDTFFTRGGDLISFLVVLAGTSLLQLSVSGFAAINLLFTLAWMGVAYRIMREGQSRKLATVAEEN